MIALVERMLAQRPSLSALWNVIRHLPNGPKLFFKLLGTMAPYTGTIDAEVRALETGHTEVVLKDGRRMRNHLGSVHAIALMNLGEVATGLTMMYVIDGIGRGIITSLKMDYLKKARGEITATCDAHIPTTPGKHDVTIEAHLRDASGEIVARATAVWRASIVQK